MISLLAANNSIAIEQMGLRFLRPLPLAVWETIGQQLIMISESSAWWIADWLVYGEGAYQDRYSEAIKRTTLDYQTLRNYAWVARRFELSRRRDKLSFAHHAEVAALQCPEQDFWLRKAEELGWSRNQLRREVRESLRARRAGDMLAAAEAADELECGQPPDAEVVIKLRLTPEQLADYSARANDNQLGLEEWVITVLSAAARDADAGPYALAPS